MAHLFLTIKEKIKGISRPLVKSIENTASQARKPPSPTRQRVSHWAVRVSVTGFSVTLTGKSVAQSVADQCRFRPSARRLASIWRAEALHVIGRKTHVLRTVCNADGGVALCSDVPKFLPILRSALPCFGAKNMRVWRLFATFAANKIMFVDPLFPHIRTI